jgi:hypothetical protein
MRRIASRLGNIFINLFLLYSNISKCHKSMAVSLLFSSTDRPEKRFLVNGGEVLVFVARAMLTSFWQLIVERAREAGRARGSLSRKAKRGSNICRRETLEILTNRRFMAAKRRELRKIRLIAAHHALHRSPNVDVTRVKVLRVHKRLKRS